MKAIIFDFDGTLADTLPICFYAFQAVFKHFDNKEVTSDEIKAMFGPSETGIIRENLMNPQHDQAIEMYYDKYSEKHRELVLDDARINTLLLQLKSQSYKLGIVTGKARKSLEISLDSLQMRDLFDVIITGDDVSVPKPDPEGIKKVLEDLKIKNTEAVFVGDSEADILAGKQADVYTIGVNWLPNYQTAEFTTQPDQFLDNIDEFMQLLPAIEQTANPKVR